MNLRFKLALRNLRSGLRGFWILLSCLTLGVSAIAIIGSLASSIQRGLAEQGQLLMGGDVEFSLTQREAAPDELSFLQQQGKVSHVVTLRAMAQGATASTLVELKAVDPVYPLYGKLELSSGTMQDAVVEPLLLQRLHLQLGDDIKLGQSTLKISGVIEHEPDRIAGGFVLGPRVLISQDALKATGLVQPGSLVNHSYRVKLPGNASLTQDKAVLDLAKSNFPAAGWRGRATDKAAQGADEFVGKLASYLTLVSIAALVVGGAGIANAVSAFVARRQSSIAILKSLGASNTDAIAISLIEILLVSVLGLCLALILGAATPYVVKTLFGAIIPLPISLSFDAKPLLLAAVLGLLVTTAFALWPLSRITAIKGAEVFRMQSSAATRLPPWPMIGLSLGLLAVASLICIFAFDDAQVTSGFIGGLAVAYLGLWAISALLVYAAQLLPRPKNFILRQAFTSLYRPGSGSRSVIMALGLGLGLFVTLALTDQTISREINSNLPATAPAFFFADVQGNDFEKFHTTLASQQGVGDISHTPMLRGRIVKIGETLAENYKAKPDGAWALQGDRGLTYADELPKGSTLMSGTWWAKDYAGAPQVSMADDVAQALNIKLGDKITVNVLGKDVEATVTSTRKVNWRSLGINFVLVFNRTALEAAPHTELVTAEMKGGDEGQVLNAIAQQFPSVTAIRVKEALQTVGDLLSKMLAAVRVANVLALLTGVLVLAGALAAGLSARSYEAVVLKTYGATRGQLLACFIAEYAVLGVVAALFGILSGNVASWFMARFALEMPFQFSLENAAATALIAMVVTIATGMVVTVRALSVKPSFYLRND